MVGFADAEALLEAPDPVDSVRAGFGAFSVPHAAPAAEEALRSALVASHRRAVLRGHTGNVASPLQPGREAVATASSDGSARLWGVVTARSLARLPASDRGQRRAVKDAAFSPTGSLLATAGTDGRARLWDVQAGNLREVLRGHAKGLNSVAFSRGGRLVLAASDDGTAMIWRTDDPDHALVRVLRGQAGPVDGASFSPSGRLVVTASADRAALLWNLARATREAPRVSGRVDTASFSPDGRTVVTAGDDELGRVWNAERPSSLRR